MRKALVYTLLAIATSLVGSCNRDHLHYETSTLALVHIEIDWETLSHISPNGVSAYIYDSNGDQYSDVVLSSDPENVYLKLPVGEYSVVFHNNSISELSGVELIGVDKFETFSIHATQASYDPVFDTLDEEIFVNEPDDVVSYTLNGIVIDENDIKYHYYKPDLTYYEQEVVQSYFIQPDHIVHVTRIIAYLDGIEFSSSKNPMAVLHGMSGGYYFKEECTSEEDVMEEFEANIIYVATSIDSITTTTKNTNTISTKVNEVLDILHPDDPYGYSDEELEGLGMIFVDCNTFGMHITDPDDQNYYLYIRFYLYDGTYTDYEVDITGYIKTEDTGTNNLHTVELILTPLQDGGGEPGDGSWGTEADGENVGSSDIFDPSLDEWVNVQVELPM
ncbi:MAG: DUF5119 domain-containing protein [Rikenellaceae bacterium]